MSEDLISLTMPGSAVVDKANEAARTAKACTALTKRATCLVLAGMETSPRALYGNT